MSNELTIRGEALGVSRETTLASSSFSMTITSSVATC